MGFIRPRLKRHLHATGTLDATGHPMPRETGVAFHYGHERGVAIEDVDDAQLLLLSLLNGEHSFTDIVERLQAHDAHITTEDVAEQLDQLAELSLLEDIGVSPPPQLNAADLERYAGQIRFFSILDRTGKRRLEMQGRLKNARVLVLGLGGLGCNVLTGLAAAGVGFIRGVDGDTVEVSNLNRQVLYDVADIGQPKALAAAAHLRRFNPEITFEPLIEFIESSERIIEISDDVDLIALCADAPREIARWVNAAALATRTPFIMGGYRGMSAEVGLFVVPGKTACLGCDLSQMSGPPPAALSWINDGLHHPTSYMTTAAAASLTCGEIIKHLTGFATPATYNAIYTLDFESLTLTSSPQPRNPQCPVCGVVAPARRQTPIKSAKRTKSTKPAKPTRRAAKGLAATSSSSSSS